MTSATYCFLFKSSALAWIQRTCTCNTLLILANAAETPSLCIPKSARTLPTFFLEPRLVATSPFRATFFHNLWLEICSETKHLQQMIELTFILPKRNQPKYWLSCGPQSQASSWICQWNCSDSQWLYTYILCACQSIQWWSVIRTLGLYPRQGSAWALAEKGRRNRGHKFWFLIR